MIIEYSPIQNTSHPPHTQHSTESSPLTQQAEAHQETQTKLTQNTRGDKKLTHKNEKYRDRQRGKQVCKRASERERGNLWERPEEGARNTFGIWVPRCLLCEVNENPILPCPPHMHHLTCTTILPTAHGAMCYPFVRQVCWAADGAPPLSDGAPPSCPRWCTTTQADGASPLKYVGQPMVHQHSPAHGMHHSPAHGIYHSPAHGMHHSPAHGTCTIGCPAYLPLTSHVLPLTRKGLSHSFW